MFKKLLNILLFLPLISAAETAWADVNVAVIAPQSGSREMFGREIWEEADAADERGEDRHAHDPRGQRTFGGGECRGAFTAAEVERASEEGDTAYEDEKDEVIEYGYLHFLSG